MSYSLYAVPMDDIEAVRDILEDILDIDRMDLVLSGAWGDYYIHRVGGYNDPSYSVYCNHTEDEDGPYVHEEGASDCPLLVSVYNVDNHEDVRDRLMGTHGLPGCRLVIWDMDVREGQPIKRVIKTP